MFCDRANMNRVDAAVPRLQSGYLNEITQVLLEDSWRFTCVVVFPAHPLWNDPTGTGIVDSCLRKPTFCTGCSSRSPQI